MQCVGDLENLLIRSFKVNPSYKYMQFKRLKTIVSEHPYNISESVEYNRNRKKIKMWKV